MKKQNQDWLKEACSLLAEEETEELLHSLDEETKHEAEEIFRRHRKKIFSLIRENSRKGKNKGLIFLRAAACIALAAGALIALRTQSAPDLQPLAPQYTASVSPFLSFTLSPAPEEASPSPFISISPTPEIKYTIFPTNSPTPHPTRTPIPTLSPTNTPLPFSIPAQWTGAYFPKIPADFQTKEVISLPESNALQILFTNAQGSSVIFTEYASAETLPVPEGSKLSYVDLGGVIALRMEEEGKVTLAWEKDGQSLSVTAPAHQAEEIARTVEKISQE